jgi:hypothetical protein
MAGIAQASERDIDYLRQLAESGAHAPLLSGRFLVWWGLLLTLAYVGQHLALAGALGDAGKVVGIIWMSFTIVGVAGQFVLARGMKSKSGSGSAGNRASRVVWITGACSIFSMVIGSGIAANRGAGPTAFDWTVPVAFAVYASALVVTGALAKNRIALAAGGAAVLMVGLFTAMIVSPDRYLLAAAGVALTVFLPGLLMLRAEPR